jgi:zinc protease
MGHRGRDKTRHVMTTEPQSLDTLRRPASTDMQHTLLPNGSSCYALQTATPGLTKLLIRFDHPSHFSTHKTVAEIAFQLMKSGTTRLNTLEFVGQMEETGAMLMCSAGQDSGVVEFTSLDDEFPAVFALIMEMISSPSMPEDEFARIHRIGVENWQISRKQPHVLAREQMTSTLFAGHPYGTLVTGESLHALTHHDVVQFHREMIQGIKPVFFLASYDTDRAVSVLAERMSLHLFGGSPLQNGAPETISSCGHPEGVNQHIVVPDTVQSAIRMGRRAFTRSHPEYVAAKVATTILGGYFSSRLMANLREDKGYTYGVGAGLITMASGGYLTISAEVGSDHLTNAMAEIRKELDTLCHQPADPDELQTVKQYLRGAALRETDGAFNRLALLAALQRQGLPFDWPAHYIANLELVSEEDVLRFARQWLVSDHLTTITAGLDIKYNQ